MKYLTQKYSTVLSIRARTYDLLISVQALYKNRHYAPTGIDKQII